MKSMSHRNLPRDNKTKQNKKDVLPGLTDVEGCRNKVFSSQAMAHYHKLRYCASDYFFFYNFCFS